ncbi:MAG: polysaccharide deacetylase family protein, partial [Bacteroidia bacterium]
SFYPEAVWSLKTTEPTLYLTFDDGPIPELTEWVLDTLKNYQIKATFFCVGENIQKHPDVYKRILAEGHSTGNHTYNHMKGFRHTASDYMENTEKCEALTGTRLFRPPYGQLRPSQYRALLKAGYKIVMWDVISYDYETISPDTCFENVKSNAKGGSIILFHDNIKAEQKLKYALPATIEHFLKLNHNFAAL